MTKIKLTKEQKAFKKANANPRNNVARFKNKGLITANFPITKKTKNNAKNYRAIQDYRAIKLVAKNITDNHDHDKKDR